MSIRNNGFLVQYDRFSLTDPSSYILKGYLAPETELSASFGGSPMPLDIRKLTENTDERYGGCETRVYLTFPETIQSRESLKVYAAGRSGRQLVFAISGKELSRKRKPIRIFIDDFAVNEKDGYMRIQGWAVARGPVRIDLFDSQGRPMKEKADRYRRFDTVELFDECEITPDNGFHIELRPIPKKEVFVRFSFGECRITRAFPTGVVTYRMSRAGKLAKKSTDVLRYNGPAALWQKTYDHLFNPAMKPVIYADWIRKHLPSDRELKKQQRLSPEMEKRPLISIVVPCFCTPKEYLKELVASVRKQSYDNWELILSDGSGPEGPAGDGAAPVRSDVVVPVRPDAAKGGGSRSAIGDLLDELASGDSRIHVLHNGRRLRIAENTNAGLKAAKGDYLLFADHDDLLSPNALYEIAAVISQRDPELIYTDEDKIGIGEKYMQPNMKPDYDPDFLCSVNYFCHIVCVKRSLYERVGELDSAFDGAQDYDFVLRCTEQTEPSRIAHIPKILYHWRFFEGSTAADPESKRYAFEAGRRAVQAHYDRLGWPAEAVDGEYPGLYRTIWHWNRFPKVSVIIPNKDHIKDLQKCLAGIDRCSAWPDLEILIVENNSTEKETFAFYEELEASDSRVRVIRYTGEFNFSAINNFGAKEAKGEYLLLLNNDTEMITDAITELMGYGLRPDVGAVGARLYYGDDTVQHAGVIIGWGGVAGHAFVNQKRGDTGYQHRIICQQDMSAVTAACMLVRASVFREAGGFTEELAVAFNDIDLCMKIRSLGYLIVYNPYAELYHYESRSRGLENTPEKVRRFNKESQYFAKCWPAILRDGDPYYSPNLSMVTQDFSLKHI